MTRHHDTESHVPELVSPGPHEPLTVEEILDWSEAPLEHRAAAALQSVLDCGPDPRLRHILLQRKSLFTAFQESWWSWHQDREWRGDDEVESLGWVLLEVVAWDLVANDGLTDDHGDEFGCTAMTSFSVRHSDQELLPGLKRAFSIAANVGFHPAVRRAVLKAIADEAPDSFGDLSDDFVG